MGFSRRPGSNWQSPLPPAPCEGSPAARLFDWRGEFARSELARGKETLEEEPVSGKMAVSFGMGSAVRIPIPGTNGLAIELTARGRVPPGGSTSTLFLQDMSGKRHLRLDYGFNTRSDVFEWHWNQRGVAKTFGITDHTPATGAAKVLGNAAKYYRYMGRAFIVTGVFIDGWSIVTASRPLRRAVQVVSAWETAAAGCELVGELGAGGGILRAGRGDRHRGTGRLCGGGFSGLHGRRGGGRIYL